MDVTCRTACDLEDTSLAAVAAWDRFSLPLSTYARTQIIYRIRLYVSYHDE